MDSYATSLDEYLWIVVVGAIVCFGSAWAIGANDVANAFGTSVGAKTLTLWQACLVAAIFEFTGAVTLGASVTATIAGAIAQPAVFLDFPEIYMYGMLCSMAAAGIWVTVATYLELAVSTTHSIIGAIMGFALVWGGSGAIVWNSHIDVFPYSKGFVPVVLSWFTSPILACILAIINFLISRTFILRRDNSVQLAFWALPVLVFKTVIIDFFFVLYKGAGNTLKWSSQKCAWVAAITAAGCAVMAAIVIMPILRRRHRSYLHKYTLPKVKTPNNVNTKPPCVVMVDAMLQKGFSADSGLGSGALQAGMEGTEHSSASTAGVKPVSMDGAGSRFHFSRSSGSLAVNGGGSSHLVFASGSPVWSTAAAASGVNHVTGNESVEAGEAGAEGMVKVPSGFMSRLWRAPSKATLPVAAKELPAAPGDLPPNQKVMVGLWEAALARASLATDTTLVTPWQQQMRERCMDALVWLRGKLIHGLVEDVHENLEHDERVVAMHQAAEIFDPEAEHVYKYLQVFSACCVSFAHGSNDVANAVGPFAGIWYVYSNGAISTSGSAVPKWILAMGGAGIVLGLATYGYNIIRVMGVKMAKISPSRGYCAELAVAMTVSVASAFGLPISTTHCIVGAEIGVGMCEDLVKGTNWALFMKTATAWVATLLAAGVLSAALFAQGAFAPSIMQSQQLLQYEQYASAVASTNWVLLNQSNQVAAGFGSYDESLGEQVVSQLSEINGLLGHGHVEPQDFFRLFDASIAALRAHSLLAVGYNVALANFTSAAAVIPAA